MKVLDLFSGIGGFSLGLERAGMKTVAFCEIEEFPRKVLAKHWPDVPIYEDVRTLTRERLESDGITGVDVICGGFPCQDISFAGSGAGLAGERSGLWSEFARLIGEIRPRYAIVENVAALLGRGLGDVLGDLAALGYDAEWHCIPASHVGAPHRRDRLWIVAYPGRKLRNEGVEQQLESTQSEWREGPALPQPSRADVADPASKRQQGSGEPVKRGCSATRVKREAVDALASCFYGVWRAEPDVGRVANGVPNRVDRLKGLGNAVVPQIPEIIGRVIMEAA